MVVKTGAKSSTERASLRRLSSLEKKGGRKSPGGRIVKELKGLDAEKAVAPHYQRPTANSSSQARVQFKPLTQSPSPHFNKVRRSSLGLESPDVCKYGRKSSLLGSRSSEKSPVKINRLKPSKSLEKTPLKINGLKTSRVFDKSPGLLKLKTPKSDLSCKTLNVARDTCSSNCKHVVKGGDLTISPEPRCPYHYCSLNHLDRVEPPSVKQFLASRRRLLRTQKSFKWVGLTPVPKGSGVGANSVDDIGPGVDTDIVIDTGHGVDIDSVVDTGQGLCVGGCGDNTREEDAAEVWKKSDDDPRPEDCQIVDCDDYDDDGLLFESGDNHGHYWIPIEEISMEESEIKMEENESMDFFAGDEDVEIDKQEIDIEAIDYDLGSSSYDYDQLAESLVDASDIKVTADESMEVFGEDKDGEDDDCDLDVEAFVYLQIVENLVDNTDVKVRAEESLELLAEDTDVKDDNHGVNVEASSNNMASNCYDHCQTEESLRLIQDKVKEADNCNLMSCEVEPVSEVCTNDSIEQFVVCEDDSDQSEETELQCYIPLNHGTEFSSPTEPDCTPGVSLSPENKYLEGVEEDEYDCKSGSLEGVFVSGVCANDHLELPVACNDDYDRIEDPEPQCLIQANVSGPECNSSTEPDGLPDSSVSDVNSSLKDEVKEEDECTSGSFECGSVSDDSDQSEKTELKCYIPVNHGTECSSPTEADYTPAVSCSLENKYLEDVAEEEYDCSSGSMEGLLVSEVCPNDHVEPLVGGKDDHDQIENSEPQCFIQVNVFGPECNSSTEPDGLPDASVSEVISSLKGEVEEDECISGSECGSVSDDSDQSEKSELKCYIPVNHGTECSSPTESDHTPGVSCSLENKYLEDIVEEEYDCSSGSVEGLSVSEVCLNDHVELSVGCKDDYDPIEDSEPRCFIQVNVFGPECNNLTEPDSLPDATSPEANSSLKGEVKEQDGCISGSSECGSISDVSAYDLIEESTSCQDMCDQSEDDEQRCFVLINALGTDCSSQKDSDGLPNVPFSEVNSCPKDEAEEEYDYVSGSAGAETASKVNADGHAKQFVDWEDDQGAKGRSDNEITELDSNKSDEFNSAGDGNLNCHIQVDTFSVQCSGSILDGFDDDYNLTSLFPECKDDSSRGTESNSPMQFNIPTDVDSPTDNSPFESSISSKFDEGEDAHTLAGGDGDCAIETKGDDFEEQYLESENTKNGITRTSYDFDDDHTMDHELYNEMSEESLKSGLKGYNIISDENQNKPYRLKFRQGRVYPFDNQNSEAEKVDLRHQMTEERRAAHEWMLDYALTNIVKKLSPFRQRKVELLVEAFETVTPLSKCETNDLPQATRAFTCSRPIQACN
ncbi:hypothetical protein SUGI_1149170 [Cryptomeria japonica]|nr:hypothetical protein SUGI_1149170 [Cryptomeria japonica]